MTNDGVPPDRPAFLRAYEAWVRAGRPGRAPSPLPYGLMTGDVLRDICAVDEAVRAETGLGTWAYYAPQGPSTQPRPKPPAPSGAPAPPRSTPN